MCNVFISVNLTSAVKIFSGVSAWEGEMWRNGAQQLNDVSYVICRKTVSHTSLHKIMNILITLAMAVNKEP